MTQTPANDNDPTPPVAPTPAYQPSPPPPPRRLTRARDDSKVAGVCGGLARYANIDATLVRVLAVVLGVLTFPISIFVYLLLWLVMPAE